jgi:hypothetical protein
MLCGAWANTKAAIEQNINNFTGITNLLTILDAVQPDQAEQLTMLLLESGVAGRTAGAVMRGGSVGQTQLVLPDVSDDDRFRS